MLFEQIRVFLCVWKVLNEQSYTIANNTSHFWMTRNAYQEKHLISRKFLPKISGNKFIILLKIFLCLSRLFGAREEQRNKKKMEYRNYGVEKVCSERVFIRRLKQKVPEGLFIVRCCYRLKHFSSFICASKFIYVRC